MRRWVRDGRVKPHGRTPTGQLRFLEAQVAEVLTADATPSERALDLEAHVLAARAKVRLLRRAQ